MRKNVSEKFKPEAIFKALGLLVGDIENIASNVSETTSVRVEDNFITVLTSEGPKVVDKVLGAALGKNYNPSDFVEKSVAGGRHNDRAIINGKFLTVTRKLFSYSPKETTYNYRIDY